MRVLYILAHFPQGSESYVDAEMAYALSQGVEIQVWSPLSGYGDRPMVKVHRGAMSDAIKTFKPHVFHIHHMSTAAYYVSQLSGKKTTVRAHSFDWDDNLAGRLSAHPAVRAVFAFPHLAARVPGLVPLPVAYDPTLYYKAPKDGKSVVRLAAGLPTKRLQDFVRIGNKMHDRAQFTLVMNMVIGKETQVIDAMTGLNKSLGGHVKIRANMSRTSASDLMRSASVYFSTYDPESHPFGMPISIAEAMATGAAVIARSGAPGVKEYLGQAGLFYSSVEEAEAVLDATLRHMQYDPTELSALSCRQAENFRSDVVLPRLLEEWNSIAKG